jgi:hypothetical protein
VARQFSDAWVLAVRKRPSTTAPRPASDPEYGENLGIDGLVKIAEVYARAAQKICGVA